ncbi:transposase [Neisseria mucosa]|uniref:Transposase n=1 Tax=Neisseria mucosa TaxID=488 RepID=A0ABM6T549_NEIMU|nr:transposase [Neisseria mucosa]
MCFGRFGSSESGIWPRYSGLNLNQDKVTKPQTVQIVRQGEATPYWFKVNPLYLFS